MDFWYGFWIITGVHFLACMLPGPDFVLVSQQSLGRGRAAGLLTALGIALGFGVHIVYSVFGLVTLVAQSAPLLTAVKIIGGLYLVYIGYKGIRAKAGGGVLEIRAEKAAREPVGKTVWRGVLCNVLNPKAVVYYAVAVYRGVVACGPDVADGGLRRVDDADDFYLVRTGGADAVRSRREQAVLSFWPLDRQGLRRRAGVVGRESDERKLRPSENGLAIDFGKGR